MAKRISGVAAAGEAGVILIVTAIVCLFVDTAAAIGLGLAGLAFTIPHFRDWWKWVTEKSPPKH